MRIALLSYRSKPHCGGQGVYVRYLSRGLAELGFLGLSIPEEAGGSGFDTLSYILVVEELARACGSTALGYAAHVSLGLTPIYLFGTREQKEKYVPQLCRGVDDDGRGDLFSPVVVGEADDHGDESRGHGDPEDGSPGFLGHVLPRCMTVPSLSLLPPS